MFLVIRMYGRYYNKVQEDGELDTAKKWRCRLSNSKAVVAVASLALLFMATAIRAQGSSGAGPAHADIYPAMPIQLIVPFAAGGPSDVVARVVGGLLAKELKGNVVVLNKPGAGTAVGMQALAAAKPDGYTIGLATSSLISNKYMGLGFTEYTKFAPLALLLNSPAALVIKTDGALRSMRDLVQRAKAQPNTITIGNTGAGGTWELMGMMMKDIHQIHFISVPYNGGAPLSVALLGGQIDAGIQSVSGWASTVQTGKLRFLAIASDQRDRVFATVPTFKEEGVDLVYGFWTGFLAPKGMPAEIGKKLSDTLVRISTTAAFQEFANKIAVNVETKAASDFESFLKIEDERINSIAGKYKSHSK
jgi:tripartite-type tricarboxylate transporter receptor subunit TctC